jgi:hypothetical protein
MLGISACNFNDEVAQGSGKVTSETRNVNGFDDV